MNMIDRIRSLFSMPQGEIRVGLYAVLFCVALAVTYGLAKVLIGLAPRFGALDQPGGRKIHAQPVPKLGGLALFIGVAVAALAGCALHTGVARDLFSPKSLAVFAGMTVMLLLGVYDDLRRASWMVKFAFQIVAACIVIHEGLVVTKLTNPIGSTLTLPPFIAILFTIVWIVGITNAINLSDGLDGLASGITLIVSGVTFANTLHLMKTRPEQYDFFIFPVITSICLLGAALAFLRFNFFPARIFLGDTGSLFLGFLIACTAIRSSQMSTTAVGLMVPAIALGLPILDTLIAFLRRTARRRNPFQADKEHIHHKMLERGLSHPDTVLVLYGFCLLLGVAAVFLALKMQQYAAVVLVVLTVIVLVAFKFLGVLDITRLWGMRRGGEQEPARRTSGRKRP